MPDMRHARVIAAGVAALALVGAVAASGAGATTRTGRGESRGAGSKHRDVLVYWDQNEEQDVLIRSKVSRLIPPWDPNGQMCIFPDGSGRFTTGYNPTLPSQHNSGSKKPLKNPPVGEAVWDRHGRFTGQTIYVPGPYGLPGSKVGGDIPPDTGRNNEFNDKGTFTGCAFTRDGRFFAADLGTAQGAFPPPDNGRIIEWFPPSYRRSCIVIGPTSGGVGPHHVDGTGGLENPGTLATGSDGSLYVPEAGRGRVLRFRPDALPRRASDCPSGVLAPPARYEVFLAPPTGPGLPLGIARDPTCRCWAVSQVIGSPAVSWYTDDGKPASGRAPVPGGAYSPFGLAVAPDGTVYFVDIHVQCQANGCGPVSHAGAIFRVRVTGGTPQPPERVAGGYDFPTSVTICEPRHTTCPTPPRH